MNTPRWIGRLAAALGGYDLFISYRHAEAYRYAKALEEYLEARGLMAFRDESEEDVGTPLSTFVRRACASRTFVLIATSNVFESSNVLAELSAYMSRRMDPWYRKPFSRVVTINVDQALSQAPDEPTWRRLVDYVYEPESLTSISNAAPSERVLERLARSSSFVRSWQRFSIALTLVAVVVSAAILGSLFFLSRTQADLSSAQASLSAADTQLSDVTAVADSLERQRGLLSRRNEMFRDSNAALGQRADSLLKETESLERTRYMLTVRNAAANEITADPVVAYRLAERSYRLSPDPANRQLVMQAASSIDLAYQLRKPSHSIEATVPPFILLKREEDPGFSVFDMRDQTSRSLEIPGDQGWVVPAGDSWRVLSLEWIDNGRDAVPTFRLWGADDVQIGESVQGRTLSGVEFKSPGEVHIPLHDDPSHLVWNLRTDERRIIQQSAIDPRDGYFYGIYGPLGVRADGAAAVPYDNGLVLIDSSGTVIQDTYTEAAFDPAFTSASWSSDGRYLAVRYAERRRLGIWNPTERRFHWLDPDGWIVESYAWSIENHRLAFSGRTVNEVDVTVELVDAEAPEVSRRVIYTGEAPVRSLAFVPGDEQVALADREGVITIIQGATGTVLGSGKHPGVDQLYGTSTALYSASEGDFRVWTGRPTPARRWIFESNTERVYAAMGAADPEWRSLAVPFRTTVGEPGIEVRSVKSGESTYLEAPSGLFMDLLFSLDGRWLIAASTEDLWIFATETWQNHRFALKEDDRQFLSLRVTDAEVVAEVIGGNYLNDTDDEYEYVISLGTDGPSLLRRVASQEDDVRDWFDAGDLLKGWQLGTLYEYRSAGVVPEPSSGWAHHVRCRDQALGARDCDVQFVPLDLDRLLALYDSLLWRPTLAELDPWIDGDRAP